MKSLALRKGTVVAIVGVAIFALGILVGAQRALGTGPVLSALPGGPIPACTAAVDASLPYRVREPAAIPAGLSASRCEVAGTPGSPFVRRTQYFGAADRGWVSVTIAPRGSTVSLTSASTTKQLTIGSAKATVGLFDRGATQLEAMYWDDGDVAIVINAMLSSTVTSDAVERLARSLEQK